MDERPWVEPEQQEQPWAPVGRSEWPSAPPHTPLWQRRGAWVVAAAVVLVAGGVGVGLAIGGRGNDAAPAASTDTSSQVHVWGSLTISGFNFIDSERPNENFNGDTCTTISVYDDIAAGTAVVIGGPTGQIGVGALSAGTLSNNECSFSFDVPVPSGLSVYTVTVSHRGTQTFTPDQLAGGVRLSLGD